MPTGDRPQSRRAGGKASSRNPIRLPREGGESLLLAALDVVGGENPPDRREPWSREQFEIVSDLEVARLRKWASAADLWIDLRKLGKIHRGRREHDIAGDGKAGHIFKITRGPGFGLAPAARKVVSGMISDWFVVQPATPAQYFSRLILGNELYPGLNALEGFAEVDDRLAIITSQPFIAGRNATDAEIRKFMRRRKFTELCEGTWYRPQDLLALFDVGGSNLFATEAGEPVPIDIMPVRADGFLRRRLEEAVQKTGG